MFPSKFSNQVIQMFFYPPRKQHEILYYDVDGIENAILAQFIDKKLNVLLAQTEARDAGSVCDNLIKERDYEKVTEMMSALQCIVYFLNDSSILPSKDTTTKTFCLQKFDPKSSLIAFVNEYEMLPESKIVSRIICLLIHCGILW